MKDKIKEKQLKNGLQNREEKKAGPRYYLYLFIAAMFFAACSVFLLYHEYTSSFRSEDNIIRYTVHLLIVTPLAVYCFVKWQREKVQLSKGESPKMTPPKRPSDPWRNAVFWTVSAILCFLAYSIYIWYAPSSGSWVIEDGLRLLLCISVAFAASNYRKPKEG